MRLTEAVVPLFPYPVDDILATLPPTSAPAWDSARFRQGLYRHHSATRSIIFNWLDNNWQPGAPFVALRAQYPAADLAAAVWACADALAARFKGPVAKLMLAELGSGSSVPEHVDKVPALTAVHRCHLPIVTNPDVDFIVDGQRFYLEPGVVYEFDNTRKHGVKNRSAVPRVHLICDIMPSTCLT